MAEHPEKRYNVIGTAALVEKMKVKIIFKSFSSRSFYLRLDERIRLVFCLLEPVFHLGKRRILEKASRWQMGSVDSEVYPMPTRMASYGKSKTTKRSC